MGGFEELRKRNLESHSAIRICRHGQPASMSLNDRSRDRQSHSHSAWLGRVEGIEDSRQYFWLDALARVSDQNPCPAVLVRGWNLQHNFPRSLFHTGGCVEG